MRLLSVCAVCLSLLLFPGVSGADRYRYSKLFWRAAEDTALRRLNYNKKGV